METFTVRNPKKNMETFTVKSYTKKELALRYFPTSNNPSTAVKHLMAWVNRCQPLKHELQQQGYNKKAKWFTAREVRLIIDHLGEP